MSKVQSRRSISINGAVYRAMQEHAQAAGFNCAEYVTKILREFVPTLPFTGHVQDPGKCECGANKARRKQACERCAFLDGEGHQTPVADLVSILRQSSDGMSLRELCEAMNMNRDYNNGQRQMWRWVKSMLEAGRLTRYWREDLSQETRAGFRGIQMRQQIACWAYRLAEQRRSAA